MTNERVERRDIVERFEVNVEDPRDLVPPSDPEPESRLRNFFADPTDEEIALVVGLALLAGGLALVAIELALIVPGALLVAIALGFRFPKVKAE